jgi:hypothetical protein
MMLPLVIALGVASVGEILYVGWLSGKSLEASGDPGRMIPPGLSTMYYLGWFVLSVLVLWGVGAAVAHMLAAL